MSIRNRGVKEIPTLDSNSIIALLAQRGIAKPAELRELPAEELVALYNNLSPLPPEILPAEHKVALAEAEANKEFFLQSREKAPGFIYMSEE